MDGRIGDIPCHQVWRQMQRTAHDRISNISAAGPLRDEMLCTIELCLALDLAIVAAWLGYRHRRILHRAHLCLTQRSSPDMRPPVPAGHREAYTSRLAEHMALIMSVFMLSPPVTLCRPRQQLPQIQRPYAASRMGMCPRMRLEDVLVQSSLRESRSATTLSSVAQNF